MIKHIIGVAMFVGLTVVSLGFVGYSEYQYREAWELRQAETQMRIDEMQRLLRTLRNELAEPVKAPTPKYKEC